jgi:hypothetical protein
VLLFHELNGIAAFVFEGGTMRKSAVFCCVLVTAALLAGSDALAGCRKVGEIQSVSINPAALQSLASIKITREKIFEALKDVSIPETSGCWSGASGNFDGQIVSAGTLQWNYGQHSLQPILKRYQGKFSPSDFQQQLLKLMPTTGKLIFSDGCLRQIITDDCKNALLAQQHNGEIDGNSKAEWDSLFESDGMIQVQTDTFVALLQSVRDDLQRLFPGEAASPRRIKWAIDTKVQQGQFPGNADVKRVRDHWTGLNDNQRRGSQMGLLLWYQGLSTSEDQGGVKLDWNRNLDAWKAKIDTGSVTSEQADLLLLTFLRSRTAVGESGYWQALTFQRRLRIILGVGCVGGDCVGT